MKRITAIIVVIFLFLNSIMAENDTLRMYNPATATTSSYSHTNYEYMLARFDLPYPAFIKGFDVKLRGDSGTTVKMHFFGKEGGVALPSLLNDIVPALVLTKTTNDPEWIYAELVSPIFLNNNQFFIGFTDFSDSKTRVITDRTNHPMACESGNGGTYYYQIGIGYDGIFYLLFSDNRAFAIDVILEYETTTSKQIFLDQTTEAGIDDNLSNSSLAAADYNNDGYQDLLVRGKFYENNKNGTFTDITDMKGIENKYSGISANAFVDMDNDGDLDIFLLGGDTSVLFVNDAGNFTEYILNLPEFKSLLSFSFADINYDGYPDLFVSQLWGTYPEPEVNRFFINNKNLGFIDSTEMIYPEYDGTWNWPGRAWNPPNQVERNRNSRGSQWVDYDNDGDLDLFVTNYYLQPDELYRNNGDGTFTDICQAKGIDVNSGGSNHGTGVDWYDYNNDGNLDLLLPQFAHPRNIGSVDHRATAIYRNEGPPNYDFTDIVGQYNDYVGLKSPSGLELEETHAGGAWGDVNNDGRADFLMTVFYGCRYIELYEQQPDNTFKSKTFEYGLENINTGTDLIWLDYDNDGRLDLGGAISGKFRLFKNNLYTARSFIELDLKSTSANKYAIGARVTVHTEGKIYTQEVSAGRGQKMQKPYRLHFGLAYAQNIDSIVVLWPTNPQTREVFTGLYVYSIYSLTEGGNIQLSIPDKESFTFNIYPNPSNDIVNFELNIQRREYVKVEIYNTLMQQVAIINDGFIPSNESLFTWSASDKKMSGGIYFCKIQIGNKSVIKQFVIVK